MQASEMFTINVPKKKIYIQVYEADRLRLMMLGPKNKSYASLFHEVLDRIERTRENPVQPQPQPQEQPVVDKV